MPCLLVGRLTLSTTAPRSAKTLVAASTAERTSSETPSPISSEMTPMRMPLTSPVR
ncbi:hypothetical protein D3C86_2075770 [compost metagenome]